MRVSPLFVPCLMLCLSGLSTAASFSLKKVLADTNGVHVEKYQAGLQTLIFNPAKGKYLRVYGYVVPVPPKGQSISFRLKSNKLNKGERVILNTLASRIVTRCFNLKTSRIERIQNWISAQNAMSRGFARNRFGPLEIAYERRPLNDRAVWTTVQFIRRQQPGVSPWINHCK